MAIEIRMPEDSLTFERYEYKSVAETLKHKPAGVYFLYGEDDKLLYVGKTKNFRTRLLSHFRGRDLSEEFYKYIVKATVYFVASEYEREVYETYAINNYSPEFNRAKTYSQDNSEEIFEIEERIRELTEEKKELDADMCDDGLIDRDFENDGVVLTGIYFHNVERIGEIDDEIKRLKGRKTRLLV